MEAFPTAEAALKAYVLGSDMSYIISRQFLSCYTKYARDFNAIHMNFRDKYGRSLYQLGITIQQLEIDYQALFGAIVSLCQGKFATSVIKSYDDVNDGVGAFVDLTKKYASPDTVKTARATAIVNASGSIPI